MLGKYSDNDIIEGIRQQDDTILNYLYNNYFKLIKNHIIRNNGSADDAHDVFQETIILLYKKILQNNFELTSDLRGFFFGIARNIWNNQQRHKSRTEEISGFEFPDENEEELAENLYEKILTRSFEKLKPECQEVLKLFYGGASFEEIAMKMNFKSDTYARRKKYLCKEALIEIIKSDPEYIDYMRFL